MATAGRRQGHRGSVPCRAQWPTEPRDTPRGDAATRPAGSAAAESTSRTRAPWRSRARRRGSGRRPSPIVSESRCRARSHPCAQGSSTPETASRRVASTKTALRRRATAGQSPRRWPALARGSIAARSARSSRQTTSATVGSSAAESSALTGGGASLWASGSQLWTGAQPTLVGEPGDDHAERGQRRSRIKVRGLVCQRRPVERAQGRRASWTLRRVEHHDPEQCHRQTDAREHQVLPARLERVAGARERHQQRRGGGGRLDHEPRDPEVVDERDRHERRPEHVQPRVVELPGPQRAGAGTTVVAQIGRRDECADQADDRRSPRGTPRRRHRRGTRIPSPDARCARCRRPRATPMSAAQIRAAVAVDRIDLPGIACASHSVGDQQRRHERRRQTDSVIGANRAGSRKRRVSVVPNTSKIRSWNTIATVTTSTRSNATPSSIDDRQSARDVDCGQRDSVLGDQQRQHLQDRRAPRDKQCQAGGDERDRAMLGQVRFQPERGARAPTSAAAMMAAATSSRTQRNDLVPAGERVACASDRDHQQHRDDQRPRRPGSVRPAGTPTVGSGSSATASAATQSD